MAGHSKWAQIKRQKGVNDAKRGALFTRLGNMIAIAARGGTDPATNATLAIAIEKAKSFNMPMSNIERSIQRVKDKSAEQVEEVLYEGYGPGGVAILVECATDNKNRTYPEVRHAFSKHGGNIAEANSVAFQFNRKGVITVKSSGDEAMLAVLDAGAEDAVEQDGDMIVYTDAKSLAKVRDAITAAGLPVADAELSYIPNNTIEITDQAVADKIIRLMEALEDLDDVVNTHTNFDIVG